MRCLSALVSVVLQMVVTNGAVNYCGARMCGRSNAHTYCQYPPGPSASCSGYVEAPLSGEERAHVLERLNRRRSQLARGWLRWPSAGDMLKLRWIEELSREAQRWADQCRPPRTLEERDSCRDLYSISVGQCVASIVGEAPGLRPESMVDMWFMQSMLYDGNITSYVPSRVKNYADFAQMMWSRTYLVGCGRSRFMTEWQGRLRSVERLVCNFAPRGPAPSRPLWTPAEPASICPPRSRPDSLPGLCTYQNDVKELENFNVSMSPQDNYLLETVFEMEKNESLDALGRLDELYLTKIAIATIGTPMPGPLYYLQKRDVFEHSETGDELWSFGNKSEVANNSISIDQITPMSPEPVTRTKSYTKTKVNIIGRPKPYDINELNDAIWENKMENPNVIQDLRRSKEKDIYAEYGLEVTEEDEIVNSSATTAVLAEPIHNDTTTATDKNLEKNGSNEKTNSTDGMVGLEKYFTDVQDEINDLLIGNKSVEDYLSDPETVRALQDALDQMEKTLASPGPASTPGKVRRELRNLEADLQKATSTARDVPATSEASQGATTEENQAKERAPMLNMVLKYMPYLKPYQDTIVGTARGDGSAVWCELSVVGYSFLLHVFVL